MPKTTLAVRNYWLTMALSVLLFAITIVVSATSTLAKVGGGEDEGSGFGGTGRSGDFDGSGFGGTGSPMPWLGYDEEGEQARRDIDQLREALQPVTLPEALRESIDVNVLREKEFALVPAVVAPVEPVSTDFADVERRLSEPEAALQVAQPVFEVIPPQIPVVPLEFEPLRLDQMRLDQMRLEQTKLPARIADTVEAESVEPQPAAVEQAPVQAETQLAELAAPEATEEEQDVRLMMPERIRRPDLPPIQRMRPAVERITISPPRPMPMRI